MPKKSKKSMEFDLKNVKGDLKARIPYIKILSFSIAINIFIIILAVLLKNRLPPEIPLYYGLPSGTGQLADRAKIVLPSTAAMTFLIINTLIALLIKNEFLKKALIITGFVLTIFSLITTIKIMLLVGNL